MLKALPRPEGSFPTTSLPSPTLTSYQQARDRCDAMANNRKSINSSPSPSRAYGKHFSTRQTDGFP